MGTVSVRIRGRSAAGGPNPPALSVADGSGAVRVVAVRARRTFGFGSSTVPLALDPAAEAALRRSLAVQRVAMRVVLPVVLVLMASGFAVNVLAGARPDTLAWWIGAALTLAGPAVTMACIFVQKRSEFPQEPRRRRDGTVVVHAVDVRAAEAWKHANAPGVIETLRSRAPG